MAFQIKKAARKQARLRIGLSGPSGSGKTYSGLLVARGLTTSWDKVCLIDTENGSGELYSDLGEYNVISLQAPYSPERYIEAMKAAEDAGMEVIVIDSVTHEWDGKGGCLELNQMLADSKYKGNTWSAWSETTPRHQKFIEAILTSGCHMVTTVRNKIDTVMGDDKKVKKVGTKEVQREGFEYELTVNFNIDRDTHRVIASKDRTNLFEGKDPFILTQETGEQLAAWNNGGEVDLTAVKNQIWTEFKRLSIEMPPAKHEIKPYIERITPELTGHEFAEENYEAILAALKTLTPDVAKATLTPEPEPEAAPQEESTDNPL